MCIIGEDNNLSDAKYSLHLIHQERTMGELTPDSFPNINDKYNGKAFYKWMMSKEYREYFHISKFNVSCSANGQLVSYNPSDPDYIDQSNPTNNPEEVINVECNPYRYTKNYITYTEEGIFFFSPSDIYIEYPLNGIWWNRNRKNTCLNVFDSRHSQLARSE
ncbi:12842_t:CDS:2 [Dentiscutata erythropus]|uniref:12842_t:CDS:1 n=1 Tax=Dentiscutata erythropus TaxID=1348616 RepID=A0A9N9JGU8_9GLOM|nr:12842_t:CDS:2 [Dentiscutata erythropus]